MTHTIKKATIKDLDTLVEFNRLLLKHQNEVNPDNKYDKNRIKRSVKLIITYIASNHCTYFLAYSNNKPIAFMNLTYDKKSITPGYIQAIYVLPEFRGQGIGFKLINKAKEILLKKNISSLTISTDDCEKNLRTINFYIKQGFKTTKKEKDLIYMTWEQ